MIRTHLSHTSRLSLACCFPLLDSDRQNVPAIGVLHAGLGLVHEDARIDTTEPAFPLEQEREILAIRLRLDLEESRQALLVKQSRRERVGGRQASDRDRRRPSAAARGRAWRRCRAVFRRFGS